MALKHIRSGTADKRPVASSLADGQIAINYQADSPGAFFKDSAGNLVKVGPIHVGATAPNATPAGSSGNSLGEAWLDNSGVDAILKVWDGTVWTPAKALVSGDIEIASINSGPLAGFRNAVINGNFDVWQRGTSFSTATYGADRWANAFVGSSCTMSRQAFTLGQTDVPGEPTYYCRMAVTSSAGAGNYVILAQRIEGVRKFAGQEITISFYAKADSSKPIAVELQQYFGTGGSPSSVVSAIGVTKTTLSSSWQKVTVTATVPSISGKTLGSDGNDYLTLNIWFDAGSDYNSRTDSLGQQSGTFDIAQVQVELGPVATPFERRPIGTELALCQRYYETAYVALVTTAASIAQTYSWKATKRGVPTVTTTPDSGSGGTFTAYNTTGITQTTNHSAWVGATVTGSAEL